MWNDSWILPWGAVQYIKIAASLRQRGAGDDSKAFETLIQIGALRIINEGFRGVYQGINK